MSTTLPAVQDYSQLAADLLARAKQRGAAEADVMVVDGRNLSVQVRLSSVDRLTKAREKRLGLRVFFGKRSASTSTSDFSRTSLDQLVADTCSLAEAVAEDPVSGLPASEAYAKDCPDLDLYDATELSTDEHIALAKRAAAGLLVCDPAGLCQAGEPGVGRERGCSKDASPAGRAQSADVQGAGDLR